ncbi:putative transcription factor interactor and regulator CCHC(Zn) family [Helianthus annuus]|uniref:Transcription factor interactor and regulator CCHC(Zn) family n=1 Tax=Helianthus annuus TaxID=4232 RepID=A0A9K3NYH8_HELAN|nr:putative transcription factor interactor and regulator CCHC(Zn) family [Helianthus annuus]KAJ0594460.1 putative transcription factor interactor and regulator CCHC(Zn) family [Helianthus annuus]KAJ0602650.1 putative transcription factor interactor and regulator CCHC(Zn) family [Helianthus annuus]KAJ0609498.1 putative transcription factor interactor and regulator CCHC(Zn) family [Helianthus annuus]KAJ0937430.1 putative transcription factor interactor and regulator CCHC(Zn) family [Helianthus a
MYINNLPGSIIGTKIFRYNILQYQSSYSILFDCVLFVSLFIMNSSYDCGESSSANDVHEHVKLPLPTCGIRATADYEGERVYTSATVLPCKHCSDEQRERSMAKTIQRRCYYCNQLGHQIAYCKAKEDDVATLLIRQAIDTGIQKHEEDEVRNSEFIFNGTDGGLWSEIWYVNTSYKCHYSGNLDALFGVETNTGENHFFFIRGIGVVDVISGNEKFRIQTVYYTPELDRNVLSLDQLVIQGYTVQFNGEKCKIFPLSAHPF